MKNEKPVKIVIENAENGWMCRFQNEYADKSKHVETLPSECLLRALTGMTEVTPELLLELSQFFSVKALEAVRVVNSTDSQTTESVEKKPSLDELM